MKRMLHIYFDDEYENPPFPPQPSEEEVDAVAYVSFMIALNASASPENYIPGLQESVDILAGEVAHDFPSLSLVLPSLLDGLVESSTYFLSFFVDVSTDLLSFLIISRNQKECPDFVNMNERCEEITASIGVFVDDAKTMNDIHLSTSEFEENLEMAILNQRLQNILNSIGSNTSFWIVTGTLPSDETDTSNGLSKTTIVVFVNCGLFVLLSVLFHYLWCRKSRPVDEKKGAKAKSTKAEEEKDIFDYLGAATTVTSTDIASPVRSAASSADPDVDTRQEYKTPLSTFHATAQSPPLSPPSKVLFHDGHLGKSKKAEEEEDIFDYLGAATPVTSTDIASPVRSAANSADPDVGTRQEYKTPLSTFHATAQSPPLSPPSKVLFPDGHLENLGESSHNMSTSQNQSSSSDHSNSNFYDSDEALSEDESQALSHDLDEALHNGDWVNAASMFSRSPTVVRTGSHSRISDEEETVAELDHLVQSKDWGAVVWETARLELDQRKRQRSNELAVIKEEASPTGVPSSPASKSFGLSVEKSDGSSDSFSSSNVTVDDVRAEIEALVRKVVPEETENIVHMIAEFEGNEEDLLKTLRAMKERLVAKKARLLRRKEAKKKALKTVKAKKQEARRSAGVPLSANAYRVNAADNTEVMEA
jgi:preprotein translocase subunit SecG